MLGVTSHFCRSSRYQVSWHGHIRIRWDTVNFCCCTCHIDHGSFCHPRHSRHFGAHAQFKVAWFELDEEADFMPKRLSDFPKCAVFTQRFEQLLPDTSLLIKHLEQAQQLSVSRGGHWGWEGEDHQLVRICLKKQRRAKRKGTKRSLGDVFCGSQKKFPRG